MARPPPERTRDRGGMPRPVRDVPHELYEGTPGPAAARRRDDTSAGVPAADGGRVRADGDAQDYRGEFEQRTVGADGAGPAGQVRSREQLRDALAARIAAEPEFADCTVQVELGPQGVTLSGNVQRIGQRERLLALATAAGAGRVEDRLQVAAARGSA